jgi:hypothetical protein
LRHSRAGLDGERVELIVDSGSSGSIAVSRAVDALPQKMRLGNSPGRKSDPPVSSAIDVLEGVDHASLLRIVWLECG